MGNFLKKLADPLDIFNGGGGGVLSSLMDPLGLFGGGKGGGFKNVLSGAVSQLVPQPQQAPAADSLMTPTVMPTAEGDAQRAARRRSQVEQAKRRGRQSTIMTGNDDSLGVTG